MCPTSRLVRESGVSILNPRNSEHSENAKPDWKLGVMRGMKIQRNTVWWLAAALFGLALLSALSWAFGRNVVWAIANVGQTRYKAFQLRVPAAPVQDESFVRCKVMNLIVDLPSEMLGSQQIEGRGTLRSLTFSDGDRKVVFTLVPHEEQRKIFLPLPQSLQSLTDARLMLEIYKTDTREFSYKMSPAELELSDWILDYRNILAYDRFLDNYFFYQRHGAEVLCLGSDVVYGNSDLALRRVVVWSAVNGNDGGLVNITDSASSTCVWGDTVSNSIQIDGGTAFDWSTATDAQVLESVRTAAQDAE